MSGPPLLRGVVRRADHIGILLAGAQSSCCGDPEETLSIVISAAFPGNVHPKCLPKRHLCELSTVKTRGKERRPLPGIGVPVVRQWLQAVEDGAATCEVIDIWSEMLTAATRWVPLHDAKNESHASPA